MPWHSNTMLMLTVFLLIVSVIPPCYSQGMCYDNSTMAIVCTLLLFITSLATYMSHDYLPNVAMSKHLTNNNKICIVRYIYTWRAKLFDHANPTVYFGLYC